jgi:hypothetical protein
MNRITIKTEYFYKLKALGVYDQWVVNIKSQFGTPSCRADLMREWNSFIIWSFYWESTPEGPDFWELISKA